MTTHYTFQICRRCIAILILLLTSFHTILAQNITEKDITETLDFDKEEVLAQVRKSVDSPPGMLTEDHHHTVHEERQVCYSSHLRPKSLHL